MARTQLDRQEVIITGGAGFTGQLFDNLESQAHGGLHEQGSWLDYSNSKIGGTDKDKRNEIGLYALMRERQ